MSLPDLQNEPPLLPISIDQVGSLDIRRYVHLQESGHSTKVTMSVMMDVPATSRGAHVSRIISAIEQTLTQLADNPTTLCGFGRKVLSSLMVLHDHSSHYTISLVADLAQRRLTRINQGTGIKPYEVLARLEANDGCISTYLGVRSRVCMACPQAQAVIRHNLERHFSTIFEPSQVAAVMAAIPIPSHNQLGVATAWVEIFDDLSSIPSADELLNLLDDCASSPTYEYLKRPDEGAAVAELHRRPRFVEDAIREFFGGVQRRWPQLPDATRIEIDVINYESTFEYALSARAAKTIGEIRASCAAACHKEP